MPAPVLNARQNGDQTPSPINQATPITQATQITQATPITQTTPSPEGTSEPTAAITGTTGINGVAGIPTTSPSNNNTLNSAPSSASSGVKAGVVAGIVIAVAVGVAIITALIVLLFIRRKSRHRASGAFEKTNKHETSQPRTAATEKKTATAVDDYLPNPADDKDVVQKTKTVYDQMELFVRNFCRSKPSSEAKVAIPSGNSVFDSQYLPTPLASSLPGARDALPLIKHSLIHYITSRISTKATVEETLLPADLTMPSKAIRVNKDKQGFSQGLSRWRVITAYLRADPSSDQAYLTDRDRKIAQAVRQFMDVFAPWINHKHGDQVRVEALTSVMQEAADLGIFLLSQAPELAFHWPEKKELEAGSLIVTPAVVKVTDEYGQKLRSTQVLVSASVAKLQVQVERNP